MFYKGQSGFSINGYDRNQYCFISFIDTSIQLPSLFLPALIARSGLLLFVNQTEGPYEQHKQTGENHNYNHVCLHSYF